MNFVTHSTRSSQGKTRRLAWFRSDYFERQDEFQDARELGSASNPGKHHVEKAGESRHGRDRLGQVEKRGDERQHQRKEGAGGSPARLAREVR